MTPGFEEQQLAEQVLERRSQVHDEQGDIWARATGVLRDRTADAKMAAELQREQRGEWDEDGNYRPSTWRSV